MNKKARIKELEEANKLLLSDLDGYAKRLEDTIYMIIRAKTLLNAIEDKSNNVHEDIILDRKTKNGYI